MRLAPGSLPWLLWWDLRIRIRERGLEAARRRTQLIYGGAILAAHAFAGFVLRAVLNSRQTLAPEQTLKLAALLLFALLFFMLMAAFLSGFRLIFAGRELSLQLGSPLPFERVLRVRVLGLVFATWSVSILLVMPVANMGLLFGHPVFLLAYPVSVAIAMLTVAASLLLLSTVVRVFGVVRARRVLHGLQILVPTAFVLMSLAGRDASAPHRRGLDGAGLESYSDLMQWPALALSGDPLALLTLLLAAMASLLLSIRLARHGILAALQVPDAVPRPTPAATGALRFRTGLFRVLLFKEWRTILRDPRIAGALLVQPLLVLPAFYGGLMQGRFKLEGVVAMAAFVAAQMSQYVANLMISAEEAPALLGAAPRPRQRLILYKCAAALSPILGLLTLAALWVATQDPWSGLVCAACCLGAAFCACAVEIARPYPAPRRSFVPLNAARRRRDPLDILSVLTMQLGWTAGAWFLAERSVWGAVIVFGVIIVPFIGWWRDANRQALLGY
ncbi:MAG: hypothetical protein NVS9B10_24810 [Nevskia sp.]